MSLESKIGAAIESRRKIMEVLGLSEDTPFRMYAAYIAWGSDVIPATGIVFDFQKNRYAKGGQVVYLNNVSEFIRLSSATKWQDGELVEVANNVPRISGEGLLIEPQRTNSIYYSSDIRKWVALGIASVDYSSSVGINGESLITATSREFGSGVWRSSGREAGEAFSLSIQAKPSNWGKIAIGSGSTVIGNNLRHPYIWPVTDLETGTTYQDGASISTLLDGWSYVSRILPLAASSSQYNTGISLLFSDHGSKIVPDGSSIYMRNAQAEKLPSDSSLGTSYIPTDGAPATRAPDILNIQLLPSQTITGDWDAGVTYTVADGIATFTGHGYIRNITVEEL